MTRKLGDIITIDFIISSFATGEAIDADSTPTCQIFQDDTDTPLISPIVAKRGENTGNYRVSVAATTGNGFSVGKSYSVIVAAVVSGVTRKFVVTMFTLDGIRMDVGSKFLSVDTTSASVNLSVYTSNLANLVTQGISDLNGDATFMLDDGTYWVAATKVGYAFTENPKQIIISSDTTLNFIPIIAVFDPPQPAETCRVFAYCVRADGVTPLANVTAKAQITHLPFAWDDTAMITGEEVLGIYDANTGLVYQDLIQGATVLFQIKEVGLKTKKLVPMETSAHLWTM